MLSKEVEEKIISYFVQLEKGVGENLKSSGDEEKDDDEVDAEDIIPNLENSSDSDNCNDEDEDEEENKVVIDSLTESKPHADALRCNKYSFQEQVKTESDIMKSQLVRKWIRDDRRVSRQLELSNTEDTTQIVRRMKRSIAVGFPKTVTKGETEVNQPLESTASIMKLLHDQSSALKINYGTNVRLKISCTKKNGGIKVIVINRSTPLEDLVSQCRLKLNIGKKFTTLYTRNDRPANDLRVLSDVDLLTIADDTEIILSDIASPVPLKVEKEPECHIEDEIVHQEKVHSKSHGEEAVIKADSTYWIPPEASITGDEVPNDLSPDPTRSEAMKRDLHIRWQSDYYISRIKEHRECLPVFSLRDNILETIKHNQFLIIAGEPGCGKTTQLPMYILEV